MADTSLPESGIETPDVGTTPKATPKTIIQEYLLERLPVYREPRDLQKQGWESEAGDTHFQQQRQRADYADAKRRLGFFKLMRSIGLELDDATSALTIEHDAHTRPAILDLCMAPGGFAAAALQRNPSALLRGISLPRELGGHEMLLRNWSHTDPNADIYVSFRDITLLAEEMGTPLSSIPASHPDAGSFSADRPFLDQKFDLVFCDGQVLRTHERPQYRQTTEPTRLLTAQLTLALQRLRPGGTLVVLLHKADAWPSVRLAHTLWGLADGGVAFYKPRLAHRTRSSFYLVARGVRAGGERAVRVVEGWKGVWRWATFQVGGVQEQERGGGGEGVEGVEGGLGRGVGGEGDGGEGGGDEVGSERDSECRAVLEEFGETLVKLARPVFAVQAEALSKAPWMKKGSGVAANAGKGGVN
ncbi:hypothetical protein B0I37DRAFT_449642 [Chaetomium sp. MPI-CAGE-AT-0009]|nr:hypothetical protein B0I37DRAFT_449642 [Chaetomium sp. MPI-CAGE-AT-0009]